MHASPRPQTQTWNDFAASLKELESNGNVAAGADESQIRLPDGAGGPPAAAQAEKGKTQDKVKPSAGDSKRPRDKGAVAKSKKRPGKSADGEEGGASRKRPRADGGGARGEAPEEEKEKEKAETITKTISVPEVVVGFLLRQRGAKLANIQTNTKTHIQIQKKEDVPEEAKGNRSVIITGTQENHLSTAENFVQRMISAYKPSGSKAADRSGGGGEFGGFVDRRRCPNTGDASCTSGRIPR